MEIHMTLTRAEENLLKAVNGDEVDFCMILDKLVNRLTMGDLIDIIMRLDIQG